MTNAIDVESLSVSYGQEPVLWDLSLSVPQGKMVGILGPNGAGKSTFLKAILGIVKPLQGKVQILGGSFKANQSRIAYVPQRSSVDWDFPIRAIDLVMMGAYRGWSLFPKGKAKALEWLERLGLSEYAHQQIGELSGGQQQRLFLARALMQEADMFFLDEPYAGVDATTENLLHSLFQELCSEGKSLFIVHHDLAKVQEYFDWVILLRKRLIASGPGAEVFQPEVLAKAYGDDQDLLEKLLALSNRKELGV